MLLFPYRVFSSLRRALSEPCRHFFGSINRGQHASVNHAQSLAAAPETRLTVLENNGLRIASEMSGGASASCTVGLWIGAGSRYESERNNGVGFLLEHLAFKGTKNYPEQAALEQEVESMGAHLSAYTSREHSAYYMKTPAQDLPKAVELLSEVVQNSLLSEADLERQRAVVLRELEEADLREACMDLLHATAFQGTPLGLSTMGPSDNALVLTRQDLVEYVNSHYKAPRMVLAAAGAVDHEELVGLAETHFGGLPFRDDAGAPVPPPCRFTGSEIRVRDDAMPLAHVAIAVEGAGATSPDVVPLMVANAIIGSYDIMSLLGGKHASNSLARQAATHNLCRSFQSFHLSYSDTGLLGIYFVTDGLHVDDMMHCTQSAWMNLCTMATESDVARGKMALKAGLARQLNGTTPTCDEIGRHVLNYGRRIPLAEWDARIDAVTPKAVRNVCSEYIYDKCPAVAAIGPIEQLPDYNRMRSAMYWLRF